MALYIDSAFLDNIMEVTKTTLDLARKQADSHVRVATILVIVVAGAADNHKDCRYAEATDLQSEQAIEKFAQDW